MTLPVPPQDIFDEIFIQLTGETSTLKSCSLVCRSFRRNTQKLLFNYTVVTLRYADIVHYPNASQCIEGRQPINLVLIVKHAPHLIEYIQELRISCSADMDLPLFVARGTTNLANGIDIFSRKGEFPINLRSLSLQFDHLRWDDIDPWVQHALMLLMSADSLRYIFLDEILDCPAELFQNLPLLKHLSLTNTTLLSLPTTRKELPMLESLMIRFLTGARGRLDQFSNDVERIVNTTQLKTFEGGNCTPSTLPVIERVLRPASNSLEQLTLREFDITDQDSVSIDLNRFSRLTDIALYEYSFYKIPPLLILIAKSMKNISHRNVIQNLLFHLEIHGLDSNIVNLESDVWQEVDTIWSIPQLVSSESFRGITFSIRSTAHNSDAFSDFIQNKLPETNKASKLHIKTSLFR